MPEFKVYTGSKSGDIEQSTTRREIGATDVLIRITHSGLCGTDVHQKHNHIALGHEGAGVVEAVGSRASLYKPGDRVGWGYIHKTCGHCKWCLTGLEVFCSERQIYGEANLDQGSMGEFAIWDENYIFKIPENMTNEEAAPMMCGGATVFSALRQYDVQPNSRVGIIGVGGLGHLAIQFAAKMGCEVVVFSGTDSKKEETTSLGAREFHATKGVNKLQVDSKIDVLLVTTSAPPDWNLYIPILSPTAIILPLTVNEGNMSFPYMPLIEGGFRIQGSMVAARQMHRDMLQFAAFHGIKAIIQSFPLSRDGITKAFETLEAGKMRYRGVLAA